MNEHVFPAWHGLIILGRLYCRDPTSGSGVCLTRREHLALPHADEIRVGGGSAPWGVLHDDDVQRIHMTLAHGTLPLEGSEALSALSQ